MRCKLNAINNLFTIILVGLAGSNQSTQSSTIRCLIFSIKQNILHKNSQLDRGADTSFSGAQRQPKEENMEDDDDEADEFENDEDNENDSNKNKLPSNDPSFQ